MKYTYTGWFIQEDMNKWATLEKPVEFPHVTFEFKPEDPHEEKFGTSATIRVVGYANDGKNEGWLCRVVPHDYFLAHKVQEIAVPHITIAVSADGKPVDTGKLDFKPLPICFWLNAVYGGFAKGKVFTERA